MTLVSNKDGPTLWLDYLSFTGQQDQTESPADSQLDELRLEKPKMHPGAIAAIAVGCITLVLVLALTVAFARHRWHRLRLAKPKEDASAREKGFEILPSGEWV